MRSSTRILRGLGLLVLSIASLAACADDATVASAPPAASDAPPGASPGAPPPSDEKQPAAVVTGPFDLGDVSILFPLTGADDLLKPGTSGAFGEVLPKALFMTLPPIEPTSFGGGPSGGGGGGGDDELLEDIYNRLRVVALRVDPCFPSLALPKDRCRAQVRLTLQPLVPSFLAASDQAIHLFYDLPSTELETFVAQLSTLKAESNAATKKVPLDVHPALAAEGVDGAFGRGLRAALLAKIGAARLSRVAAMALVAFDSEWKFFAFDIVDGKQRAVDIARAGITEQSVRVTFGADGDVVVLSPVATDDRYAVFNRVSSGTPPKGEQELALGATLRIENPTKRDAESVSCVGCHLAGPLRQRASKRWGLSDVGNPEAYGASGFDLGVPKSSPVANATVLRSFGYLADKPVVNQRVINESAAVAAFLNARQ